MTGTTTGLYMVVAVLLVALGLGAAIVRPLAIQRLIALNVLGSAVFLYFVAIAARASTPAPDPVPHAMVLTGIVVAVSVTAFAVGLLRRIEADDPDGDP